MNKNLSEGTKIEAVAASMAAMSQEWVPLKDLIESLDTMGFKGTSADGTRTCIARDFKRRGWSKAKHINELVHYSLTPLFYKDCENYISRFIELKPDFEQVIKDNFASLDSLPGFIEPEQKREPKKTIVTTEPNKKKFGGKQAPALKINGCVCSYSTLLKAIMSAQTEPFTRQMIIDYANRVQNGLNQYSIGNAWYQIKKKDWIRETLTGRGFHEITNEFIIENKRFMEHFYAILPNHIEFIDSNYEKAKKLELRPLNDPEPEPEPEIQKEQAPEPEAITGTEAETVKADERIETPEPDTKAAIDKETNIEEIRELAIALGVIEEKPAIDPKVFIGECIVQYLQATSNGNAFSNPDTVMVPKVKTGKQEAPERPVDKDEYILRMKNLHGQLQTMRTAKEKAERLARQLESANFELKQHRTKLESELNKLKFESDKKSHLAIGEKASTVKLAEVARFR